MTDIKPFDPIIPQEEVDRLFRKLGDTRLPEIPIVPDAGDDYGTFPSSTCCTPNSSSHTNTTHRQVPLSTGSAPSTTTGCTNSPGQRPKPRFQNGNTTPRLYPTCRCTLSTKKHAYAPKVRFRYYSSTAGQAHFSNSKMSWLPCCPQTIPHSHLSTLSSPACPGSAGPKVLRADGRCRIQRACTMSL